MINQQLLDYIEKQRQAGVQDEAIKQALLEARWAEADVNEGFDKSQTSQQPPIQNQEPDDQARTSVYEEQDGGQANIQTGSDEYSASPTENQMTADKKSSVWIWVVILLAALLIVGGLLLGWYLINGFGAFEEDVDQESQQGVVDETEDDTLGKEEEPITRDTLDIEQEEEPKEPIIGEEDEGGGLVDVEQKSEPEAEPDRQPRVRDEIESQPESELQAESESGSRSETVLPPESSLVCDTEAVGKNRFVGCLYGGSNFDVLRDETLGSQVVTDPAPRSDTPLDLTGDWVRRSSPDDMQTGPFSIRWRGRFTFEPGEYGFFISSHKGSGVRVRVNGTTKIDKWDQLNYGSLRFGYMDYFNKTFDEETELLIKIDYFGDLEVQNIRFGWSEPILVSENQYCQVDYTQAPYLKTKASDILQECHRIIPILEDYFKVEPSAIPYLVRFRSDEEMGGSVASGGDHGVSFNIKYLESRYKTETFGTLAHELTHLIQTYTTNFSGRDYDHWLFLTEGIADYSKYYIGEYLEPGCNVPHGHYLDGYRCAAMLLHYIESHYQSGFVLKVHQAMNDGTYTRDMFEEHTGKSVEELWSECREKEKCGIGRG